MNWHKDKTLFTPGPLTTSLSVKQAMLHDAGSWHYEFNQRLKAIQARVLSLAGLSKDQGFEMIFMQGSGTFGVEAVLSSTIAPESKILIVVNGAYGERMVRMTGALRIPAIVLRYPENELPRLGDIREVLESEEDLQSVAVVHCETTTGLLNPIEEIGELVGSYRREYIVDAMSSFGALPIDFEKASIDYLISSPNKCLEGVPGFSFVLARRRRLENTMTYARCLSLDLFDQWDYFERKGQFRYTPPTHSLLAFEQALNELDEEGGIQARGNRYQQNHAVLVDGMRRLGFQPYLDPDIQSCIITSFRYPDHPQFDFNRFYRSLSDRDMIIYPGKLTETECFRIGSIGRIQSSDVKALLSVIADALEEMDVDLQVETIVDQ